MKIAGFTFPDQPITLKGKRQMNEETATAGAAETSEATAKVAPAAFPGGKKKTKAIIANLAAKKVAAKKKAAPAKAAKPAAKKAVRKAAAPVKAKRPVAKKAAAKKVVNKKAAAPAKRKPGRPATKAPVEAPRSDYKAGDRVKVTKRGGDVVKGKVTSVDWTATGPFVNVNIGDDRKPVMFAARPVAVKAY